MGVSLNGGIPRKPMVVGYHHLRKPPYLPSLHESSLIPLKQHSVLGRFLPGINVTTAVCRVPRCLREPQESPSNSS